MVPVSTHFCVDMHRMLDIVRNSMYISLSSPINWSRIWQTNDRLCGVWKTRHFPILLFIRNRFHLPSNIINISNCQSRHRFDTHTPHKNVCLCIDQKKISVIRLIGSDTSTFCVDIESTRRTYNWQWLPLTAIKTAQLWALSLSLVIHAPHIHQRTLFSGCRNNIEQ